VVPQFVFLSAGGEFKPDDFCTPSSKVINTLMSSWFGVGVNTLLSQGVNEESIRSTKVFRIHREGAIQIGGMSAEGYPMVYEAMMAISLKWLINGRLLFIVRRQQVEAFSAMLDQRLNESRSSYFSYTSDKKHWNDMDEHGTPLFNIIIVREDELDELEGINITDIRAVYLFSLGVKRNALDKLQGIGRVGRLGQGNTYTFIMVDCSGSKRKKIEAETEEVLMNSLSSNSAHKPHVVEVRGAAVLQQKMSDIPVYVPAVNPSARSQESFDRMVHRIADANKIQVCKFIDFDAISKGYVCKSKYPQYCSWYHPTPTDFVKYRTLSSCRFNVSYCKAKLFFLQDSLVQTIVSKSTAATPAPWFSKDTLPSVESKQVSSFEEAFPALGQQPIKKVVVCEPVVVPQIPQEIVKPIITSAKPKRPPQTIQVAPVFFVSKSTRSKTKVCIFAAVSAATCMYSRRGEPCIFRHPEVPEDEVTPEELAVAKAE